MEFITLNNGVRMPLQGFGVFQIYDLKECECAVLDAIATGYRLIDTAAAYENEEAVGAAIKKSAIAREELFITTKLWVQDYGYKDAKKAFQSSIDKLGIDYLDLYMIHQPLGDYYSGYRALEELYKEGKIRAIGVCNFYPERLADLCIHVDVLPAVNQVECHPFFQQTSAMQNMKEFGVQMEAWGPLAEGGNGIFFNHTLLEIGEKYGKSVAQVVLRWNVQRGVVVIPKSVNKERIEENLNIWDFTLSKNDMDQIAKLDIGHSEIIDHSSPLTAKLFGNWKIHGIV